MSTPFVGSLVMFPPISSPWNRFPLPFPSISCFSLATNIRAPQGFKGSRAGPITSYKVWLCLPFMSSAAAKSYGIEVRGHGVPADCSWPPSAARQHTGPSFFASPEDRSGLHRALPDSFVLQKHIFNNKKKKKKERKLQKSRSNKIFINVCGGLIYSSAEMINWLIQFTDHFLFFF